LLSSVVSSAKLSPIKRTAARQFRVCHFSKNGESRKKQQLQVENALFAERDIRAANLKKRKRRTISQKRKTFSRAQNGFSGRTTRTLHSHHKA
jgi:predicted N-acyltransferase